MQTAGAYPVRRTTRLLKVENADPSLSPDPADIAALKQELLALVEHLRQTGVGALPLEPPPITHDARSDEQLVGEAERAVQVLYERQKRIQDGAGVVAGLLGWGLGSGLSTGSGLSSTHGSG